MLSIIISGLCGAVIGGLCGRTWEEWQFWGIMIAVVVLVFNRPD